MEIKFIILGVVLLILGAIAVEGFLKRGKKRRPLAETLKPNFGVEETADGKEKIPLGMEAIDMKVIDESERLNINIDQRNRRLRRR